MTFGTEIPDSAAFLGTATLILGLILGTIKLSVMILAGYRRKIERDATERRFRRYFPDEDDPDTHSIPKKLESLEHGHAELVRGVEAIAKNAAENTVELQSLGTDLREHMAEELEKDEERRVEAIEDRKTERKELEGLIGRLFQDWREDATAIIEGTPPAKSYETRARAPKRETDT